MAQIPQGAIPSFVKGMYVVNLRELTVEWGHCDPAGIVFHPRFIEYFDWCCSLLLEKATGLTKAQLKPTYGLAGIPIIDMEVRFLAPVSYNDRIKIFSTFSEISRSSFVIRHCLLNGETTAVECSQTRIWCTADPDNPHKLKACAIPEDVVAKFKLSGASVQGARPV
jgi:4-hydroxybenzoyl-CoA thioesterase